MANWFAIYKAADSSLVSSETDDALQRMTAAELAAAGLARVAIAQQPDSTHTWNPATKTLQTITPGVSVIQTLQGKTSATWTLADLADWLKAKG
jgi:hypothetical protein